MEREGCNAEAEKSGHALRKGDQTRLRIIENTISLFAERGYSDTSIQAIADQSGITQTAVLNHFKSKKVLLGAVRVHITESVVRSVDGRLKPSMSAVDRLYEYLVGNIEWALKNRHMSQIILLNYYMGCFDDEFHQHIKATIKRAEGRASEYTLACQREGLLSRQRDAHEVAQQIHSFLMGYSLKLIAGTRSRSVSSKISQNCQDFLKQLLDWEPDDLSGF